MASGPDSNPIRILHLSDFHFSEQRAWDADPVMNQLAEAIGWEVSSGRGPDLVAITGDLAFSGKAAEYEQARQWLEEKLWPRLAGLSKDRLLLVPGNHDVDRSAVKRGARALHGDLLEEAEQQSITEVLADPDERSPLVRRHDQYLAFHNAWYGAKAELPWWQRDLEIRGQTLHLLGLDSAWLACGDEDYGKLLLSRYQLNQLLFPQPAPSLRIALLHHPWSYLAEFEQHDARALVHQHCDLVLRGHLHQPQSERILPPDPSRACLELAQRLAGQLTRDGVKANPSSAVLVAEILGLALAKKFRLPADLKDGFRTLCLDAIEDEVPVQSRLTLGLCLGDLGDPRVLDLRDPNAYVEVPAGTYPYGERDETISVGQPFLLSRYPVTNSQYRAFIEAGGYENPGWWSETGWAWRKKTAFQEPDFWNNRHWSAPNLPVVGVSFWEAEACCAWAGGRLPGEQEWEAAARGPEGCEYPWCGDWENGICNSAETGLNRTSPVGLFPRSRQAALDLEDLTGNVDEWCGSFHEEGGDDAAGPRVLRGGAFNFGSGGLRASGRFRYEPEYRVRIIGFRCVLAPRRQP